MSSNSDSISDSFISGKSVLGNLAGAYLDMPGKCAESEEFRELFLSGDTIFTDANITFPVYDDQDNLEKASQWNSYFPAPLYINKTKKSKKLVNILKEKDGTKEDCSDKGDLPKKLKNQYLCEIGTNIYDVAEVEKEIIYHHSKNGRGAEEGKLYFLEAVKENQYFKGRIYTDWKNIPILSKLLDTSGMRFGKSKMVQYGLCEFPVEPKIGNLEKKTYHAKAGDYLVVTFCSDAIFMNEKGYTVKFEEVKQQIASKLGIKKADNLDEYSILQTKEVIGYHTKWNLKRPGIPAVKAGSTFVYQMGEGMTWEETLTPIQQFIGERNLEGYGEFSISNMEAMQYDVMDAKKKKEKDKKEKDKQETDAKDHMQKDTMYFSKNLLYPILSEKIFETLVSDYLSNTMESINLNASTIGRITLMLKESLNNGLNSQEAFQNFCERIASIKREKEKREAFRFLKAILLADEKSKDEESPEYVIDFEKMNGGKDHSLKEMKDIFIQYFSEEKYQEMLAEIWGKYLMTVLTYHKYRKKYSPA